MQLPQLYCFVFYVLQLNIVESYCETVKYSLTYLSFASFNALANNLVRLCMKIEQSAFNH